MKKILSFIAVMLCMGTLSAQTVPPPKVIPVAQYYAGGQDSLYAFINRTVVYPPYAKRNRISGEIIMSFTLDENGKVKDAKVTKDVAGGGGLGKEALRVLNLIKFTAPGFSSPQSLPIIFKL